MIDVTILTTAAYIDPPEIDDYINNVLTEDRLVQEALEAQGLSTARVSWDDKSFDWSQTKTVLFRTIWDYFERYDEFELWLKRINKLTHMINPMELVGWNIDKHYLGDLQRWGVNIVPTIFIEKGDKRTLTEIVKTSGWSHVILKPAISGTARHTYKIKPEMVGDHESIFNTLIANESMLLQPFIDSVLTTGEVSHMVFNGKHSHSILKQAKPGDFRVQDDFGGTVSLHKASAHEMAFAEDVVQKCKIPPLYARVDVVKDNAGNLAVAELEVIEPELWFRHRPAAAQDLAKGIKNYLSKL